MFSRSDVQCRVKSSRCTDNPIHKYTSINHPQSQKWNLTFAPLNHMFEPIHFYDTQLLRVSLLSTPSLCKYFTRVKTHDCPLRLRFYVVFRPLSLLVEPYTVLPTCCRQQLRIVYKKCTYRNPRS